MLTNHQTHADRALTRQKETMMTDAEALVGRLFAKGFLVTRTALHSEETTMSRVKMMVIDEFDGKPIYDGAALCKHLAGQFPGIDFQYGYHGCHKASLDAFKDSQQVMQWNCTSAEWGHGRLRNLDLNEYKETLSVKLAKFADGGIE
jgi:hypothetical protein